MGFIPSSFVKRSLFTVSVLDSFHFVVGSIMFLNMSKDWNDYSEGGKPCQGGIYFLIFKSLNDSCADITEEKTVNTCD